MEFRWLTSEEQQTRVVESQSLSEILALAQRLQAEADGQVSDDQVVEMGRELGVQPEYVREALNLRRRAASPATTNLLSPQASVPGRPVSPSLGQALALGVGLGTLPMALIALANSSAEPVSFFVLIGTLAAGWSARHPRLAGRAGSLTALIVVLASTLFLSAVHPGFGPEAFIFSLLSFTPLGAGVARFGAALRGRLERIGEQPPHPVSGH
jgi:hypothetical protein